jgi:hypothetical protein
VLVATIKIKITSLYALFSRGNARTSVLVQLKVGKKFGSVSVVVGFSIYTRFGHSFVKSHLDLWYLEPLSGGGEIKYKRVASGGEKVHGDGGGGGI